ncbi:MAG: hypothetical protein ACFFD8_01415 [Candidatus Thorarchaeota archaeon]
MTKIKQNSQLAIVSLTLSLLGLGLLPLLFTSHPPTILFPWQSQLIGLSFMIICVLGIIAGISPSHCSRSPQPKKESHDMKRATNTIHTEAPTYKMGHHPTCHPYSSHTIRIKDRVFCAGCTGLVTGALIALIGTTLFFFLNFQLIFPQIIFWIGFIFVALGLIQHLLYRLQFHILQHGGTRIFLNILFVVGSFLLLASLWQLTNSLAFAAYMLLLILYWILTRIIMSRHSHRHICRACEKTNCPLSDA